MRYWTVTNKADGTVSVVITEKGKTPFECGYEAETHTAVPIAPAGWRKREADIKRAELIAAVKRVAAQKIDAVSPIWRQINDLRDGPTPDSEARRDKLNVERKRSNEVEIKLSKAKTMEQLLEIFGEYERSET